MVAFPNAKINLGLNILRRRSDGYHDISTVMMPVGWKDILEIVPAGDTTSSLTVSGNHVDCPPEKNLVMKALRLMESCREVPASAIYLRKIIPDGAGLGGGSADAAFTLTTLNTLYSLGLSDGELEAMAAKLGADCPFFVGNRPMLCSGIGTEFTPVDVDLSGLRLLIVKPPVHVSTAEAYAGVSPRIPAESIAEIVGRPVAEWRGRLVNDFETSVFARHPELAALKEYLYGLGAVYASMSGSGSSVYGLFPLDADNLSERVTRSFGGCVTFVQDL